MSAKGFFRTQGGAAALSSVTLTTFFYNTPRRLVQYQLWWWNTTTLPMTEGDVALDDSQQLTLKGESTWGFWLDDVSAVERDVIEDWCINHFMSDVMNGRHVPMETLEAQQPPAQSGHRLRRRRLDKQRVVDVIVHGMTHLEILRRTGSGQLRYANPRLVYNASVREAKGRVGGDIITLEVTAPTGNVMVNKVPFGDAGTLTAVAVGDYLNHITTQIPG